MKRFLRPLSALFLAVVLTVTAAVPAFAYQTGEELARTARYVQSTVFDPQVASIGGEWAVIGLARSGLEVPQSWYDAYLSHLTDYTAQQQGVLSARKYTEYSRVVLALTALGENPRNVAGYDLLAPLEDGEATLRQGINGAIYALIALDSGSYDVPQGLREQYRTAIRTAQLSDGGWALAGERSDPDVTAQALQALAPYRAQEKETVERGLAALETLEENGSFTTLESYAQTIIALCALGEEPGTAVLDGFFSYRLSDGSFCHLSDGPADGMATEQALCALAALARFEAGEPALYQMSDMDASSQPSLPDLARLVPLLSAPLALIPACALGLGQS